MASFAAERSNGSRVRAAAWIERRLGIGQGSPGKRFEWHGRVAFVVALTTLLTLAYGVWVFTSGVPPVDFVAFWAAGDLAGSGHAVQAYDYETHRAVEMTVAKMAGPMPFAYPPPFLFLVTPFAFRPIWLSYLAWVSVTAGLYLTASRRLAPSTYALAQPAAFMNAVGAQNGFLTSGIFIAAASFLETQPLSAGVLFGLLICKPQLAVLVPIALAAGREWRAFAAAAATSGLLLAVALIAFGTDAYVGFLTMSRHFGAYLADGRWRWTQLASIYALSRSLGLSNTPSLLLQAAAAAIGILATWRAWALRLEQRVPVLAASTLLVSPYLFTYDTLLMLIPIAWFVRQQPNPVRAAALWLGCVASVAAALEIGGIPNLMPLTALAALWWLHCPQPVGRTALSSLRARQIFLR